MQVILLAAGRSTRLDPISDKNLLEFSGKTLLEHQISALKKANMRDIVVVANAFNLDRFKKILKGFKNVLVVTQEKLEEGMAGGVLAGAKKVSHKNIMVVSTNDLFEPELFEKAIQASKNAEAGVIVGTKVDKYFPGGYLKFGKDGLITDIVEKPAEGKEPGKYVNLVLHIYNDFPKFLDFLKKAASKKDDLYEVALDQYIKKGKAKMEILKYHGYWQPIKFPWHVLRVMEHFLEDQESRVDKTASISKTAIITGNVVIGPKVKVLDYAIIRGPAYLGEGSVIADRASVRASMVGSHCVVGYATEVTRSYLNNDVWSHTNYIGDSVVDSNVSFGSGTVLGNLRFDEGNIQVNIKNNRVDSGTNKFGAIIGSGTRFGINVSTNPGVKIGRNVFIGGNVLVEKDIPDDKIVLLKQELKITVNSTTIDMGARKEMKKGLE
ncbi:hypothetical protein COY07_03675 [Candidatus Peregrinibacteria bacterium CG_4_10_14_0_2_um_filter_43_11]|nr:MAG: hypothetical protein COY07_03675 [Candidatus Peregrinibacteria bacterium CG_4_10_14_0_2_um_filter_43_11]